MKPFWERIRNRKKAAATQANAITMPLPPQQGEEDNRRAPRFAPPQLVAGCGQSNGRQRDHNEDSLFAVTITLASETGSTPLGLYVVADGMGGHQYGEVASSVAARTVAGVVLRKFHPHLADPSQSLDESLQEIMRQALNDAQRAVMQAAPGSGTTVTAALILGQQLTIAHVGDSRAYLLRPEGRIEPITRDHSLVHRLQELGQITADEAATHPQRNVLYRALGQGELLDPDVFTAPFPLNGSLLLCSDGLWGVVPEDDLVNITRNAPSVHVACQDMVEAANAAGGPDNISVILVQLLN